MTNTKFRKRALLSSVAMLLVALVALGSATFAWFVDDPNADAKGLNASSQSSTGLQIKTDSSTSWSHHAKIAAASSATGGAAFTNILLSPAMFNKKDGKFYSVKAAAANASAPLTSDKWALVNTLDHQEGNGVYNETIDLRVTGTTNATQDIKLTGIDLGTAGNMADAVTVVLKNGTTYYTFSRASRDVNFWDVAITAGTTTYSAPVAANKWTTTTAAASGLNLSVASIAAGTNQEATLELYVYLDGTHSSVYSDNAVSAASIITKCDLYFTNATQA